MTLIKKYRYYYHQILMDVFEKTKLTICILAPNIKITYKSYFPISVKYSHKWIGNTQIIVHGSNKLNKTYSDL